MAMKLQNVKMRDSVEFELPLISGAAVRVQQMHADALAADDVATVIVPPPRQLRAVLVTDGNYFLEKAIKSLDLREPGRLKRRGNMKLHGVMQKVIQGHTT